MTRDSRLDVGRCLAALFVIYVHSSVGYISLYGKISAAEWHTANLLNSIARVCVPLFIMMSGALVLGKPVPSWSSYIKRRSAATLKPYLFGAVLYLTWDWLAHGTMPLSMHDYVKQFLLGGAYYHLYFLFILLGLYVIAPILQEIGRILPGTLISTTMILFALAITERHIQPYGLTLGYISLGICYSYLPYFLSGYLLYNLSRPCGYLPSALFTASTLVTAGISWLAYKYGSAQVADPFVQYTSFNVVIQSLAAYWLLLQIKVRKDKVQLIQRIADLTLGIYIIHIVVLSQISAWMSQVFTIPLILQAIFYPIATFVITALLTRVLHAIPGIKGFV